MAVIYVGFACDISEADCSMPSLLSTFNLLPVSVHSIVDDNLPQNAMARL